MRAQRRTKTSVARSKSGVHGLVTVRVLARQLPSTVEHSSSHWASRPEAVDTSCSRSTMRTNVARCTGGSSAT